MNSEELEQSLRTEFENYLKEAVSELKQEVSGFQEKVESHTKAKAPSVCGMAL